jgi:hypothetical protein
VGGRLDVCLAHGARKRLDKFAQSEGMSSSLPQAMGDHGMSARPLVVTYPMSARSRAIVAEELAGAAEVIYLTDLAQEDRADALRQASAVLANDTAKELRPGESSLIGRACCSSAPPGSTPGGSSRYAMAVSRWGTRFSTCPM